MKKKFYYSPVTEDVFVSPMGMLMESGGSVIEAPGGSDPTDPFHAPRKPF